MSRRPVQSTRPRPHLLWLAHLVLVVVVGGYTALSAVLAGPDANIGLALGLLGLGVLGAPWTIPLLGSEELTVDSGPFVLVAVGGALLNLVLHAAVSRWHPRARRRS